MSGCKVEFSHTDCSWRCDVTIPWNQLGMKAKPGDIWRANVISNTACNPVRPERTATQVAWCQAYEFANRFEVNRLGYLVFE